jgi:hypothetical protein
MRTSVISFSSLFLLVGIALRADRITPKATPADYPVRTKVGRVEIAADFLVHSFFGSDRDRMFFARDFLVVEVAFYPDAGAGYRVDTPKFTLRLNGKKDGLLPESIGTVAYSMKYPDQGAHPALEAAGGVGGVLVGVGPPPAGPRFPTDPTGTPYPNRLPPRAPGTTDPNVPKPVRATLEEVLQQTALEDGGKSTAIAGRLFFAYSGNVKKLKSVELLYDTGTDGVATLRLR